MSSIPGYVTREEAAQRVGRSVRTIRSWQMRGLRTIVGLILEDELLEYDRKMRERKGRPRKVDPRAAVLADVVTERTRQDAKWGEQNHPDGTGADGAILGRSFDQYRDVIRATVDQWAKTGESVWAAILAEEVFEALAEDDPMKLRAELIQVAAVAVQWVEAIDRRGPKPGGSQS